LIGLGLVGSAAARPNIEQEYQFTERQLEKARQRVTQLEARLEELGEERARLNPTPPPPNCDDPFVFDSNGIKQWRSECSQPMMAMPPPAKAKSCDMPFRVDADGIKRPQLECVSRFE
jgi:hypothetical protein